MDENPVLAARAERKWSQRELGRQARVSPREIRKAERDQAISFTVTAAIAYAIERDAKQLDAELVARRQPRSLG